MICFSYRISSNWTKDGSEVKRSYRPSTLDFAWLNLVYPAQDPAKFEQALSDSGIEEQRNSILTLYLDGEWEKLRSRLSTPKSASSNKGFLRKFV
jgi:hypothetical protein